MQRDVHVIEDDSIVDEAASSRFLVKLNLAPLDILDVYGLGGAADFSLDDANYRGTLATLYGGGIRPMLLPLWFFQSDLNVSADLQYLAYTTSDEIAGEDIEARYQEFQAALIIAYKLQGVVPYGGVKFNPITIHMTGVDNDLAGDTNAGVFIGTDYFVTPNVFFNGELSIFSETSIFLMVGYGYPGQR
ncbi:MAG: hypothetical protein M5R36_17165 [Deltaproteobacteria bacterium]|nr:hypothetical protein [Deltaproteobacteria bacterium]